MIGHLRRFEQAQTRITEILGVGIGRGEVARQHLHILGALEALADDRCGRQRVATGQGSDHRRLLEHGVELAGLRGHRLAHVLHCAIARLLKVLRHRVFAPLRITVPAEPSGQQQQYARQHQTTHTHAGHRLPALVRVAHVISPVSARRCGRIHPLPARCQRKYPPLASPRARSAGSPAAQCGRPARW